MGSVRHQRAERSVRKQLAEHRVRLCEEKLQALRKALLDADKDLQDMDDYISGLQGTSQQVIPPTLDTLPIPASIGHPHTSSHVYGMKSPAFLPTYESEPSEDSGSCRSVHSE